MEHFGKVA